MWVIILDLVLLLQSVMFVNGLFENGDSVYFMDSSRDLIINSPNYPNKYASGSNGRFTVKTDDAHEVYINCTINLDKSSTGCSTEYFYVSADADPNLRGASQFCGIGNVERVSEYSTISFAYVSTAARGSGVGGVFSCRLSVRAKACDCGWSLRGRITGGTDAAKTEFPSTVGLVERNGNSVFCDGSIINTRTIITAAHCSKLIPNGDTNNIYILAGYNYLTSTTANPYAITYLVSRIIEHPSYNPTTQLNDIALLVTSINMEWSRGIGPICLPLDTVSTFDYKSILLVGWGTTSFGGPRPTSLQKATSNVITNSACQQNGFNVQSSQLCTYANGRDACQFDSGGPVILSSTRQYLCGIISYGRGCGGTSAGVNTRVTSFIPWIRQNLVGSLCFKPYS